MNIFYIKMSDSVIKFIQQYDGNFDINSTELDLSNNELKNIDLTGLVNLEYLDL